MSEARILLARVQAAQQTMKEAAEANVFGSPNLPLREHGEKVAEALSGDGNGLAAFASALTNATCDYAVQNTKDLTVAIATMDLADPILESLAHLTAVARGHIH